jgi:release factor glutamine methyltransferase
VGIDISKEALNTAKENASQLGAHVKFELLDVLTESISNTYNVIVSNPPYVLENEKAAMQKNVLNHEPPGALFVPNSTPLLFYKRITEMATKSLSKGGSLYFEINEQFGPETVSLLVKSSFKNVILRKDLSGKDRFVSGQLG